MRNGTILFTVVLVLGGAVGTPGGEGPPAAPQPPAPIPWPAGLPVYDHVVIVVEEN
ncbi:MAG: hypothetical protein JWO38_3339, partial [Gemmataceae bacterium]|nr:hypothetical protein [Gemmataceae bacterium]